MKTFPQRGPSFSTVRTISRGEGLALAAILVAGLVVWGWAPADHTIQPYYAAAVHSMSQSAHSFLFAGFDPVGVVTVDKPPLSFWAQTLAAWIFGFHPWVIVVVQAIEGAAAVFVLNRVVRRWGGPRVALLAAGLYALTPIVTAINRDNLPDAMLVLMLLLGAYFLTRAIEETSTRWLLLAGAFVGLGFLSKMLAAWIVLPAFALAYFVGMTESRGRRLARIGLAGVVAVAVSLSWPVLVSVWPGARPFVGSTTDGSIWQLAFGYNGLTRLVGGTSGIAGVYGTAIGSDLGGAAGPLRLFNTEVGGQISWLLPIALVALVVAAFRAKGATPRTRAGWTLWGTWLLAGAVIFSFTSGVFHSYYTAELAPAIAALAAAGLATAWRWHREGNRFVLPLAIAGTSGYAFLLLDRTPDWQPWLRYVVLGVAAVAVIAAFVGWTAVLAAAGLLAIVAGPLAYIVSTVRPISVLDSADPTAGPAASGVAGTVQTMVGGNADTVRGFLKFIGNAEAITPGQAEILAYAQKQAPTARITLATEGGTFAADPFLLNTDAKVAPLGGYLGFDPSPTAGQLGQWTSDGELRFVLLPQVYAETGRPAKPGNNSANTDRANTDTLPQVRRIGWLVRACRPVPPQRIGPDAAGVGVLFDCVGH